LELGSRREECGGSSVYWYESESRDGGVENKQFPPSTSPTGMNLGVGMVVWRMKREAAVLGSSFLEVGGLKRGLVR
jgi:hypothetical protein